MSIVWPKRQTLGGTASAIQRTAYSAPESASLLSILQSCLRPAVGKAVALLRAIVAGVYGRNPVRGSSTEERGFCEEDQTRCVAFIDRVGCVWTGEVKSLMRRCLDSDIETAHLRQKYPPIFRKVLPGKKTATFFELDRRISMMIDVQLTSRLPIMQSQD